VPLRLTVSADQTQRFKVLKPDLAEKLWRIRRTQPFLSDALPTEAAFLPPPLHNTHNHAHALLSTLSTSTSVSQGSCLFYWLLPVVPLYLKLYGTGLQRTSVKLQLISLIRRNTSRMGRSTRVLTGCSSAYTSTAFLCQWMFVRAHTLFLWFNIHRLGSSVMKDMYTDGFWAAPSLELTSSCVLLHKQDLVRLVETLFGCVPEGSV
jgi:hypothetical protein